MTFGEKLQLERKAKKMTRAQLADKAGVSLRTINNYEAGSTYPQNKEIYDILAGILEVDRNYLYNEGDLPGAPPRARDIVSHRTQWIKEMICKLFEDEEMTEDEADSIIKDVMDAYWAAKDRRKQTVIPDAPAETDERITE